MTWKMVKLAYMTYVTNVVFKDGDALAQYLAQPGPFEAFKQVATWPASVTRASAAQRLAAMDTNARVDLLEQAMAIMPSHDLMWYFAAKLAGVTVLVVSNVDYTRDDRLAGLECVDYKPTLDAMPEAQGECRVKATTAPVTKVARGSTMDLLTNALVLCDGELQPTRPLLFVYKHVEKSDVGVREIYCPVERTPDAPGTFVYDQLRDAPYDLQNVLCCLAAHRAHRHALPTVNRLFDT
jgi:hypothetical protein